MEFWLELDETCNVELEQRRGFLYDVKPVVDYLNGFFRKIKFPGTKQIRIQLTNDVSMVRVEKPIPIFPVCRVVMYYDLISFFEKDDADKKKAIVDILMSASVAAAEEMNWNSDCFLDAYNEIKGRNYVFEHAVNRKQRNVGKSLTAQIMREIIYGAIVYRVALTNVKTREKCDIPIATFFTDKGFDIPRLHQLVVNGGWVDDLIYEAHNDSREIFYRIDTITSSCTVHFMPTGGTIMEYMQDKYEYAVTDDAARIKEIKKRWF